MLVEQFPGSTAFRRVAGPKQAAQRRAVSKMHDDVRTGHRAQRAFIYDDHTDPVDGGVSAISTSASSRGRHLPRHAQFSKGSVKILNYDAFRADMQTRFTIDGRQIMLEHINLQSDGAVDERSPATSTSRTGPTWSTT
jgi:hypothetical protein